MQNLQKLTNQCTRCGICLPHCASYNSKQKETFSPRGRINQIEALHQGELNYEQIQSSLEHCLRCYQCESVCPAGVDYQSILHSSLKPSFYNRVTAWVLSQKPLTKILSWFVKKQTPFVKFLSFKNAEILILNGCGESVFGNQSILSLQKLLQKAGVHANVVSDCCGAFASGVNLPKAKQQFLSRHQKIIALNTGCVRDFDGELIDAMVFLHQHIHKITFKKTPKTLSFFMPCSASDEHKNASLACLENIPELKVRVIKSQACCGGAGSFMFRYQKDAQHLLQNLQLQNQHLLTSNISCQVQLSKMNTVAHPIDFLFQCLS